MEKNKSAISEQILSLTLEILYLLTGEDYIIVKKPKGQTQKSRPQVIEGICRTVENVLLTPQPIMPQEDNELKILDLTHKMLKLLTREVPIRCQDVAVYLSMEEWEYIEGHKDLYQDVLMENHQNTELTDGHMDLPHHVASDLVMEDDRSMDFDSETESLKTHNSFETHTTLSESMSERMTRYENGNLSDVGQTHYSSICIKEEPWDEEITIPPSPVEIHSILIKEESASYDGENLTDPNISTSTDYIQHPYPPNVGERVPCYGQNLIRPTMHTAGSSPQVHQPSTQTMEEPFSDDRGNLTPPSFYTVTAPSLHPSIQNPEEPSSRDSDNLKLPNFYTVTGSSLHPSIQNPEEPSSCVKVNLTHPNIYRPTAYTNQHPPPSTMEESTSSIKEDLHDAKLHTQHVPNSIKKKPVNRKSLVENKTRGHPTRQSKSTLGKTKEPAARSGRKLRNLKNPEQELPAVSAISGNPTSNDDNEAHSSPSVYSVHQSDNAVEIMYHCPSCHKGFFSNLDLARHQVIHTVDKLFVCSICGKRFTEMSFVIKHQVIHTDLKLCVCKVCGDCFYSEASLAKHQKSHAQPVYCSLCGRYFFDKTEMEIHKRTHTQNKLHTCQLCGKEFIAKSALTRHLRTHQQPAK